ncbi:ABC transporter permease [Nocardioides sp. GY 10127]|uniref:ABC transporter permease n=1 Tax=Nocardioides sp. GY 10127 TaxID=2569762 RepID=UPI0010A8FCD8|nr:ABC transporter permease [Nocardioides sp. GY 10127]TIC84290.1 ABC transporter permease [Nocardioides sp. GY 10127]
MSAPAPSTTTPTGGPSPLAQRYARARTKGWLLVLGVLAVVSLVRIVSGTDDITSEATLRAAILAACPILLAGLGGLWSERAGVVNIGLEGQMLLGTWGAAYFTYWYGPWHGLLGAALLGAIGGLLHAVATVTFGVDHVVSGVAINIIGLGATTFMAEAFFSDLQYGGPRQLTGLDPLPYVTVPGFSDAMVWLNDQGWFLVSDVAGFLAALSTKLSVFTILIVLLVLLTSWVLWRTPFGLRLRACGESPSAAESLGVNVYLYKYVAVLVSGAFAGLGGAFLALVSASGFVTNQSGGRGYIGLAAMIFGNWTPWGTVGASAMFGYTDALRLRSPEAVHALLLLVALGLLAMAALRGWRKQWVGAGLFGVFGLAFLLWYLLTDTVPREFTGLTPYLATLLVLSLASQRLRPPAADGLVYRKGSVG